MAAPTEVFRYTSLPAEIRNTILEYALVPGDVYPCPEQSKPTSSRKRLQAVLKRPSAAFNKIKIAGANHQVPTTTQQQQQQSGFHLLTTCKSIYHDGRYMFYAMNTFHLPAGSALDAETWLTGLPPAHRSTIRSAGLTFSLADLTPDVLAQMEEKWLWDLRPATAGGRHEHRMVFEVTYLLCWRFWQDKIRYLRGWEGLESVVLMTGKKGGGGGVEVFEGDAFRAMGAKEERGILDEAREVVKGELEGLVQEGGWKATRRWLMTRGNASGG